MRSRPVSRSFTPAVAQVGEALHRQAGSYLRSIIRCDGLTCQVCATPIDEGAALCQQCDGHQRAGLPLASRTGFVVYAPFGTQAYQVVSQYKSERPGPAITSTMAGILAVALRGHYSCSAGLSGLGDTYWAVVPSTRGRLALSSMVEKLARSTTRRVQISYSGEEGRRVLDPSVWAPETTVPPRSHLLLIDDSWVSGARAQSVASAMVAAGFEQVSVLVAARVMTPGYGSNQSFIEDHLTSFDWQRCPWTGDACPD
ncbi:hypothetical protein DEA06_07045 [Microbacterium sp. Gd 4-13]|nr:hypothetical protein DEA06_07045 [Microbacterium sp. Gd 4-13]